MVWTAIILDLGLPNSQNIVHELLPGLKPKLVLGSFWENFPENRIKFGLGFRTVQSIFERGLPRSEVDSLEFCTPSVNIPLLAC